MPPAVCSPRPRWSLDNINWEAIETDRIAETDSLFYIVAAASFMESTTDRYTSNLIAQFSGDGEITDWLEQYWLPEEMQHGDALRRYVQIVWPEFDWDQAYASFLREFSVHCRADELEPTRTREMASRCVVEMGTAGYYTTLSRISPDPVLATIAGQIAADEIRHYKHFYRYFRKYQQLEPESRRAIIRALLNRLRMINGQDGKIAVKHVHCGGHCAERFDARLYRQLRRNSRHLVQPHFPHRMCVQMLLSPLGLSHRARVFVVPVVEIFARWIVP